MDIILINTVVVGLFVVLGLVISYKLNRRRKIKKFNLLKIKQYGGVVLTASEKKFVDKNCQLYNGKIAWGMFDSRRFTLTNLKEKGKLFLLRLNPLYKYNKKISDLEKEVEYHKSDVEYFQRKYRNSEMVINEVSLELNELKNPKKKQTVPEFVKKAQDYNKSNLDQYSTAIATSRFA